eukprot:TRINITY_DN15287_c0_g1_i1.p1 TRINITY_DN15287_c0_g1~~TRINITY_DN15287_c0_g1_i1.p1  ORF type:complete len:755 (+),score=216.62 TRINITY_DN15287_c0_g1_i1:91-2265(+)
MAAAGSGGRLIVVTSRVPLRGGEDIFSYSFFPCLEEALGGTEPAQEVLWVGHGPDCRDQAQFGIDECFSAGGAIEYVTVQVPEALRAASSVFSNSILWPVFHGNAIEDFPVGSYAPYYASALVFRDTLVKLCRPGDTVWVHNYQLLLLPKLLRDAGVLGVRIGFFLHVPFPSSEIYHALPWKRALLEGMLGADLLGFHTHDYAAHFTHAVTRILGIDHRVTEVVYQGRAVHVGVFPIGPNVTRIRNAMEGAGAGVYERKKAELKETLKGKKVIISVERMDFTQGIPQKLLAVERMFEDDASLVGSVVLVQLVIPIESRSRIPAYRELRREVEELVGRVNGRFTGDYGQTSVYYKYGSVSFAELVALYSVADVWLNTAVRDGMNLLAQEFVVCQRKNKGALILSEFTGAARVLGDALRVNPWNVQQTAAALRRALAMSAEERADRHRGLYDYVAKHTAATWGRAFLAAVRAGVHEEAAEQASRRRVVESFRAGGREGHRMLVLSAAELGADAAFKTAIGVLARQRTVTVLVIDPRGAAYLDEACAGLDGVYRLAAYGSLLKRPAGADAPATWEPFATVNMPGGSAERVLQILRRFADATPGSLLERPSPQVIRWSWGACWNPAAALAQASQCCQLLKSMAYTGGFRVALGAVDARSLEVYPQGLASAAFVKAAAQLPPFQCAVFIGVRPPGAWADRRDVFAFDRSAEGVAEVCRCVGSVPVSDAR